MSIPAANAYSWAQEFRSFTPQHWTVVAVCAGIMALWCVIGRFLLSNAETGRARERVFRHWTGWFIVVTQSFIFIRRFMPGHWDIQESLPLHMCRWDVWIVAWLMLTLNRKARALTLFWGLGLSTQVFFTPFLKDGHGSLSFWIYWLNHLQIVGVAVYDIVALGYRPNFKDLRFAIIAGIGFAVLVFVLNILLGTNYAYLGPKDHDAASVIDKLGPYPWRAIWMVAGSAMIMVILYLFSKLVWTIRTQILGKAPPRFIESDSDE